MSNFSEPSDFAAFCRYKQWQSENQHSESTQPPQPPQPAGPQHPGPGAQRPPPQRPFQHRAQTHRQTPSQNSPEVSQLSVLFRCLVEMKKRVDDIYAVVDNLRIISEETKATVEGSLERMHGNLERFEVFRRGVLKQVSQPPNNSPSQPQASSSPPLFSQNLSQHQTTSNPQNKYDKGQNSAQPPSLFVPLSNYSQPLYTLPLSQVPELYPDPNYME